MVNKKAAEDSAGASPRPLTHYPECRNCRDVRPTAVRLPPGRRIGQARLAHNSKTTVVVKEKNRPIETRKTPAFDGCPLTAQLHYYKFVIKHTFHSSGRQCFLEASAGR